MANELFKIMKAFGQEVRLVIENNGSRGREKGLS